MLKRKKNIPEEIFFEVNLELEDLPQDILNAETYKDRDYYVYKITATVSRYWIRISFDKKEEEEVHIWGKGEHRWTLFQSY